LENVFTVVGDRLKVTHELAIDRSPVYVEADQEGVWVWRRNGLQNSRWTLYHNENRVMPNGQPVQTNQCCSWSKSHFPKNQNVAYSEMAERFICLLLLRMMTRFLQLPNRRIHSQTGKTILDKKATRRMSFSFVVYGRIALTFYPGVCQCLAVVGAANSFNRVPSGPRYFECRECLTW